APRSPSPLSLHDALPICSLKKADSCVDDISDEQIKQVIDSGNYRASSDYSDAVGFDFAIITVPTPLEESMPDLGFIEAAGADLRSEEHTSELQSRFELVC